MDRYGLEWNAAMESCMVIVMIPYLVLFFSLGLLFLFTDNTFVFTNHPILSYNYSFLVITITSPSDIIA